MTYEEALKIIKEHEAVISRGTGRTRFGNALYIAMYALEKQTRKKLLIQQNDKEIYMYCPNCDMPFESSRIKKIKMYFCFNCGQALDWSEDE